MKFTNTSIGENSNIRLDQWFPKWMESPLRGQSPLKQSTETKRIVNTTIKLARGPAFAFSLAGGGGSHPCHSSVMPLIRCIGAITQQM